MIRLLAEIPTGSPDLGQLASDLRALLTAGVAVTRTAVLLPECTEIIYRENEEWLVDGLLKIVQTWSESALFVRSSLATPGYWLDDGVVAPPTFVGLSNSINRILRSWGSPRSRASRITSGLGEADAFPAIVVQPFVTSRSSLVTRHAVTGELIGANNWKHNVNNVVQVLRPDFIRLIATIDQSIRRPVKIHFSDQNGLVVFSISNQPITPAGQLTATTDLLRRGLLTPSQYVLSLSPDTLVRAHGITLEVDSGGTQLQGIGASPGFASGKLAFRPPQGRSLEIRPSIFATRETVPDDIHSLDISRGVIQFLGGMTSHAAMVCRGMGRPCVVGISKAECLDDARRLILPSGREVNEGADVAIDGISGTVVLDSWAFKNRFSNVGVSHEVWQTFRGAVKEVTRPSHLARLPIPDQLHVAGLISRLREADAWEP